MTDIATRLDEVLNQIAEAATAAGRAPGSVELVAVSKTHPPEAAREAFEAGQRIFGENKVQELTVKAPLLPPAARWHFLGHLQSNKIRKLLPHCELIHGVDSLELARDIDRVAAELGLFPQILLEVNVSGEVSKFGFTPDRVTADLDQLLALPRVRVEGFMTMAPVVEGPEQARPFFARLRELRDTLAEQSNIPLPILSMGMSADFEPAIAEGATHVRIGTAIFGNRPKP